MRWLVLLALCACSSTSGSSASSVPHQGSSVPPVAGNAATCEDVRTRVEQLYRTEAEAQEPKRVDEAVADNTAMVMNDCVKQPGTAVPCLAKVGSVPELEQHCLIPLDEEGTEGEELAR